MVEGYTDVLALVQAGVANVVASMGTALTEQQLSAWRGYTRNIYLCFDADAAGMGAMSRALVLARRLDMTMHVVRVPEGLDPADHMLAGHGGDEFRELADGAQTLLQFQVRSVLSSHDLAKPEQRARAFTLLRGVLAEAPARSSEMTKCATSPTGSALRKRASGYLLSAGGASAGGSAGGAAEARSPASPPRRRPASVAHRRRHELEVRFLAACLAVPVKGRAFLADYRRELLRQSADARCLCQVSARLKPAECRGKGADGRVGAGAPEGESEIFSEVVIRSQRESFDDRVARGALPASAGGQGEPAGQQAQDSGSD